MEQSRKLTSKDGGGEPALSCSAYPIFSYTAPEDPRVDASSLTFHMKVLLCFDFLSELFPFHSCAHCRALVGEASNFPPAEVLCTDINLIIPSSSEVCTNVF
jgi:hypothetical protein